MECSLSRYVVELELLISWRSKFENSKFKSLNSGFKMRLAFPLYLYTRIGSNKGKSPEHNQAKHTKHPHSLEWHNSTITIVFPSTFRNTLVCLCTFLQEKDSASVTLLREQSTKDIEGSTIIRDAQQHHHTNQCSYDCRCYRRLCRIGTSRRHTSTTQTCSSL